MTERGIQTGVQILGPMFVWIVRNIHSRLHHLSWQKRVMNVAFFLFPMAIARLIYTYMQGYFPPDSHKLREAIGQPKGSIQWAVPPCLTIWFRIATIKSGLKHATWEARYGQNLYSSPQRANMFWGPPASCANEYRELFARGFERPHRELTTHRCLVPRQPSTLHGAGLNCAQEELCCYLLTSLYWWK